MTTRTHRTPRRRTVVALAVVLVILIGFVVRLVDIQVVNAGEHVANSQSFGLAGSQPIHGERGSIVDAAGIPLAESNVQYDCQLDPMLAVDDVVAQQTGVTWHAASEEMATITGQSVDEVRAIVTDALADDAASRFAYLDKQLTTAQYRDLTAIGVPYLACLPQTSRSYPNGAVAGNLLGFTNVDDDPIQGLELSENTCLAAEDGSIAFQQGADGVIIPGTEVETPAVNGGTVTLTIDSDLQWYLQQLIGEQVHKVNADSGTITVIEADTGKVRAAAEYPSVDPNDPGESEIEDRNSRIFIDTFEPGSTMKPLTAAMLLDTGRASPESTVTAPDYKEFPNGARVRDSQQHPTYEYTLTGVLIDSSNVGIATLGERLRTSTREDYMRAFGFGEGSAIGFMGEESGYVRASEEWDNQTVLNTAFGQGLTTTIPELLGAYTAIAGDGSRVPLSLIESCTAADGTVTEPEAPESTPVVSADAAAQVRSMMENVYTQAYYADDVNIPGYRVGVKTGTAEKPDGNGGYKPGLYFTTMIGFAPADDPQFIVAVTLDEPTRVRSSAANVEGFQKAMTQVLKTYRVMPSSGTAPDLPKFG